ncbi:MAG: hypothetical protein IID41_14900 [Planctomycetes bacterium]|nr:hypothetical protein [Planctomycetota bacterium]
MAASMTLEQKVLSGGRWLSSSKSYSAGLRVSLINEPIPLGTDTVLNVAIDVSAVKSFFLISDVNVTIETNDGTTPTDTLNLIAGVPYIWNTDSLDSFLLTGDVTKFFITNASDAIIDMEAVADPTP